MKERELTPRALSACLGQAATCVPGSAMPGLATYIGLLLRWNKIMNLTGAATWEECAQTLVADCLRLVPFMEGLGLPAEPEIWDPGAGAGLPGIPLRLCWDRGRYTMIEIRQKRAMFLSQCIGTLKLARTFVHMGDVRVFAAKNRPADCIVSRAFMPWEKLLGLAPELLQPNGCVVFMASDPCPKDLPSGWEKLAETGYPYGKGKRYFWAVRRAAWQG